MSEPADNLDPERAEFAAFYDELPLWSAPFGLRMLEEVPLRRGATILDVGAGTGFLALELAQRCGEDARVIAVDPWRSGAARLRQKLSYLGIENVRVVEGSAADLVLAESSVDLVVSNLGINNFDEPDEVLRTCWQVAKPSAELIVTTNLQGHMREFYDEFREALRDLGQTDAIGALESHIRHRGSEESVRALLEHAGFDVVSAETEVLKTRFADASAFVRHRLTRIGFEPAWRALVPAEHEEAVMHRVRERLNEVAKRHGELAFTIPMLTVRARKP